MKPAIFADAVIALLLLLSLLSGAKRGMLKSLAGVVVVLAALLGASLLANRFADDVAVKLQPVLQQKIEQRMQSSLSQPDAVSAAASGDTQQIQNVLRSVGLVGQSVLQKATDAVKNATASLAQAAADGMVHTIAYALVYLVSFLLLWLLLSLLTIPLHLATQLPGLHALNAIGGAVLGLAMGGLLLFLAVWLLRCTGLLLTDDLIQDSVLLRFFAENSPVSVIASLT